MGFFKSLVKQHGKTFFEPIGKALQAAGIKKPNPLNPAHAWALKGAVMPYLKWLTAQRFKSRGGTDFPAAMPPRLRRHAEFACDGLQGLAMEISRTMSKFQLALADRQCRMAELSQRAQDYITILCTSLYGARQADELLRAAADIACQDLARKLKRERPTNKSFRAVTELGQAIADGQFQSIEGLAPDEILMGSEASSESR
jgi:hypothetical protein